MPEDERTIQISAKEAVKCVRGPMTNVEVMERFRLTPHGFVDLLKQLFRNSLITEEDLARRGIRFKVRKKKPEPKPIQRHIAPPAALYDDEFLDTASLTELLSSGESDDPVGVTQKKSGKIRAPQDDEELEVSGKKGRFSITGFFKKHR